MYCSFRAGWLRGWAAVIVLGAGALCVAYEGVTQVGETGQQIVDYVKLANQDGEFRGAVLAARQGKVIAAVAVGDLGDGSKKPLKVDSLFEIASCTKPFTALAVMKLVEDGKLDLDDSIAKHLPGTPADCEAITVRHLLQHTSGIPGTNTLGRGEDLAAVLPTFLDGGPRHSPGEHHEYWNQGYALLSEVITQASGKPYTEYLREAIFEPAKMKSTRFTGQRPPQGATVATGLSTYGAKRTALEHPYGEYGFQYRGMGGIVTNLIDLWRWDRAIAKGEIISAASLDKMTTPGEAGYALGWRIDSLSDGKTVHNHTGSVRGFLASIQRNPADDGCLFVLAASDDQAAFNLVTTGCEAILAGRKPPAITKPSANDPKIDSELVDSLVGTYRDEQGRTLTVSRQGKLAKADINWHGPITYGYLGAGEGDELLFGTMARYSPKGFAGADKMAVEREGNSVTALVLTIVQNGKSIRFERTQ